MQKSKVHTEIETILGKSPAEKRKKKKKKQPTKLLFWEYRKNRNKPVS